MTGNAQGSLRIAVLQVVSGFGALKQDQVQA